MAQEEAGGIGQGMFNHQLQVLSAPQRPSGTSLSLQPAQDCCSPFETAFLSSFPTCECCGIFSGGPPPWSVSNDFVSGHSSKEAAHQ